MAHHERDISLGEAVKRGLSLRAYIADVLMVPFAVWLLPRCHGVAVVDAGAHRIAHAALKGVRMTELSAPVGEDERHGIAEQASADSLFHPVKDSFHACGFLGFQEPSHHEAGCTEVQGQEHLPAALTANNSVHFSHPGVRAFPDECLAVLIGTPLKDSGAKDFGSMCPARFVPDLFGKIEVAYGKRP